MNNNKNSKLFRIKKIKNSIRKCANQTYKHNLVCVNNIPLLTITCILPIRITENGTPMQATIVNQSPDKENNTLL